MPLTTEMLAPLAMTIFLLVDSLSAEEPLKLDAPLKVMAPAAGWSSTIAKLSEYAFAPLLLKVTVAAEADVASTMLTVL